MAATWAAVGAISSVIGGLFGGVQANSQNAQAQQAYEEQKRINKEQADITNAYNLEVFEAEKKDYFAARQFQYDMAVDQWQYDTEIQDFRYLQDVKAYAASAENYVQQLNFNNVAAQMSYESQQAAFNELLASTAFEGQANLLENLQAQGQAALTQAGASRAKAIQTTLAEQGRNAAIMSANLRSGAQEAMRGMRETALQKRGADMQAASSLMIKPERLPELLKPVMGPERTFVEPAKVLPGAVPPPTYSSPFLPIVQGFASGAMGIANVYA